jgi:hypothetical protein
LVSERTTAKSILKENEIYAKNTTKRNFDGMVLAYVTPWYDFLYESDNSNETMQHYHLTKHFKGTIMVMTLQRFSIPSSLMCLLCGIK